MPSAKKTPNIQLNQWIGNEYVKRQDFVDDNLIIDKEIKKSNDEIKKNSDKIGNLPTLTTTKKDSLVNAVNELDKDLDKLKATYTEVTLETGKWSGQTYSLETNYPSNTYDIEIELSGNATKDIAKAWGKTIPVASPDGRNVIKALGTVPSVNIPIRVKAVKK